jgi:hypothetical protein
MNKKEEKTPYARINNGIDTLIKKHGSEKTADFIQAISISQSLEFDKVNIDLQKFIFAEVIKQFRLKPSLFEISTMEPYKQARMSCFYFYSRYCNYSPQTIKLKFPKIKKVRTHFYWCIDKINELVGLPSIDKQHYAIHIKADEKIQEFIKNTTK